MIMNAFSGIVQNGSRNNNSSSSAHSTHHNDQICINFFVSVAPSTTHIVPVAQGDRLLSGKSSQLANRFGSLRVFVLRIHLLNEHAGHETQCTGLVVIFIHRLNQLA